MLHQWATLGEYDFVNMVEAPDDATIARSVGRSSAPAGSVKFETLPLIEVDALLSSLE